MESWRASATSSGLIDRQKAGSRKSSNPSSKCGVSLAWLEAFASSLHAIGDGYDLTVDVVSKLIVPAASQEGAKSRFWDLVPDVHKGDPDWYISHAWNASFPEMVDRLGPTLMPKTKESKKRGLSRNSGLNWKDEVRVWVDVIALRNQSLKAPSLCSSSAKMDIDEMAETIQSCKLGLVAVSDPALSLPNDIWHLYEVWMAVYPTTDVSRLRVALPGGVTHNFVIKHLVLFDTFDIGVKSATRSSDKTKILSKIKHSAGTKRFNNTMAEAWQCAINCSLRWSPVPRDLYLYCAVLLQCDDYGQLQSVLRTIPELHDDDADLREITDTYKMYARKDGLLDEARCEKMMASFGVDMSTALDMSVELHYNNDRTISFENFKHWYLGLQRLRKLRQWHVRLTVGDLHNNISLMAKLLERNEESKLISIHADILDIPPHELPPIPDASTEWEEQSQAKEGTSTAKPTASRPNGQQRHLNNIPVVREAIEVLHGRDEPVSQGGVRNAQIAMSLITSATKGGQALPTRTEITHSLGATSPTTRSNQSIFATNPLKATPFAVEEAMSTEDASELADSLAAYNSNYTSDGKWKHRAGKNEDEESSIDELQRVASGQVPFSPRLSTPTMDSPSGRHSDPHSHGYSLASIAIPSSDDDDDRSIRSLSGSTVLSHTSAPLSHTSLCSTPTGALNSPCGEKLMAGRPALNLPRSARGKAKAGRISPASRTRSPRVSNDGDDESHLRPQHSARSTPFMGRLVSLIPTSASLNIERPRSGIDRPLSSRPGTKGVSSAMRGSVQRVSSPAASAWATETDMVRPCSASFTTGTSPGIHTRTSPGVHAGTSPNIRSGIMPQTPSSITRRRSSISIGDGPLSSARVGGGGSRGGPPLGAPSPSAPVGGRPMYSGRRHGGGSGNGAEVGPPRHGGSSANGAELGAAAVKAADAKLNMLQRIARRCQQT
eukprot:gene12685-15917_t